MKGGGVIADFFEGVKGLFIPPTFAKQGNVKNGQTVNKLNTAFESGSNTQNQNIQNQNTQNQNTQNQNTQNQNTQNVNNIRNAQTLGSLLETPTNTIKGGKRSRKNRSRRRRSRKNRNRK
jgi:hypothetical protein